MKYPHSSLILLSLGVLASPGFSQSVLTRPAQKPIVMAPPAPPDGSTWSRAPAPAQRPLDDVKGPDGQAIDQLPPNTPAANTEAPVPAPRVAILQGGAAPAAAAYAATATTEPALTPTGRTTTYAYASGASATTRPAQKPIVMAPPAPPDGSVWSRAPAPAQRPLDDVKGPDGQAIDQLPPNTPASNTEPVVPPPRVAIFQPAPAPGISAEPALLPTGRSNVAVATTMDATNIAQSIRGATAANRDQVIADIESRMKASEKIMTSMSGVAGDVTADAKAKASALKKSIRTARKDWEHNREQLAADYEAYAAALARVDAANGVAR